MTKRDYQSPLVLDMNRNPPGYYYTDDRGNEEYWGNPDDTDPKYSLRDTIRICDDAKKEYDVLGAPLASLDYQERCGPKSKAYIAEVKRLANSKLTYGRYPKVPDHISD